jgi:hypothetical protein
MRNFLVIGLLLAAFWAIDAFAFDSQYRKVAWLHAYNGGNQFQFEVQRLLKNLN